MSTNNVEIKSLAFHALQGRTEIGPKMQSVRTWCDVAAHMLDVTTRIDWHEKTISGKSTTERFTMNHVLGRSHSVSYFKGCLLYWGQWEKCFLGQSLCRHLLSLESSWSLSPCNFILTFSQAVVITFFFKGSMGLFLATHSVFPPLFFSTPPLHLPGSHWHIRRRARRPGTPHGS